VHERVGAPASKFLDIWQGFSCCQFAAVLKIEAVERSESRFGPKPSSPKAEEELIVAIACQESTRTQGVTLKANDTETKSARCRAVLIRARSSVSRAFVV
jgi:hypothetical protein